MQAKKSSERQVKECTKRRCDVTFVTSHHVTQSLDMSIGSSGRIVIEVEPEIKRQLYSALARDGLTLKDWFLREAQSYLINTHQLKLELSLQDVDASKSAVSN